MKISFQISLDLLRDLSKIVTLGLKTGSVGVRSFTKLMANRCQVCCLSADYLWTHSIKCVN